MVRAIKAIYVRDSHRANKPKALAWGHNGGAGDMANLIYAVVAAALSGACFYFSNGVGEVWAVAWIAALPILWLAYGNVRAGLVIIAAFVAYGAGQANVVMALWKVLPFVALLVVLILPSALFALTALFARFAARRLKPYAAVLAFPALWTTWEFIFATNSSDGTAGAFAYSQAGVPEMVQLASVFGIPVITFLLMLNSSLLAMALRKTGKPTRVLAGVALLLFGGNILFGLVRLQSEPGEAVRVAMLNSDALGDAALSNDGTTALRTVHAYATAAAGAARNGVSIIVMSEKIAVVEPAWRYDTFAALQQAADRGKVTIVAGFDSRGDTRRNVAMVFRPNTGAYQYNKRHLVAGLEDMFQPGFAHGVYEPGRAVAVCKDMDFAGTLRGDAEHGIRLMLVPAWDFKTDGWAHARMAMMRGVEGGYAVVRTARHGFLIASDAYGRIVRGAPSTPVGFSSVTADVPLGPGETVYVMIGDAFAWLCVGLTLALLIMAMLRRRRDPQTAAATPSAAETAPAS
jgi:apolipoprotein N-acyltransferase